MGGRKSLAGPALLAKIPLTLECWDEIKPHTNLAHEKPPKCTWDQSRNENEYWVKKTADKLRDDGYKIEEMNMFLEKYALLTFIIRWG